MDKEISTKEMMADSRLNLTDPHFDDKLMRNILLLDSKQKKMKTFIYNMLLFTVIEFALFSLVTIYIYYFQGLIQVENAMKSFIALIQGAGNLAIQYDYLILSFILAGILDIILNKRLKVIAK